MANPNYNAERQKYIPGYFTTTPPVDLAKCTDIDTKLGEMLSNYSVMSKVDDVEALSGISSSSGRAYRALHLTRRGTKFFDICAAKMNISQDPENKYRVLVIPQLRGKRIRSDFDENQEILVFDRNGFLVANPKGINFPTFGDSLAMVIDGTLYIAFKHERYSSEGPSERDTSGEQAVTSSMLFSVVVITTAKSEFEPYGVAEFRDPTGDPSRANYDVDSCTVTANFTELFPARFGIDFSAQAERSSINQERLQRWSKSSVEDFGFFIRTDLKKISDEMRERISAAQNTAMLKSSVPEIRAEGIDPTDSYGLDELRNIYNEMADLLVAQSSYVHFLCPDSESATSSITKSETELWWEIQDANNISAWGLKPIRDYLPFSGIDNTRFSLTVKKFPKDSQICVQNREVPFTCSLTLENTSIDQNTGLKTYDIKSYGDNENFSNCLKALKLFDERHGLMAIPLVSLIHVMDDTSGSGLSEMRQAFPLTKLKTPDVMIWVDGVKLVPYEDYVVEEGNNMVYSGQYIRMMQLPDTPAASTDPSQAIEDNDDCMFPLPLDGRKYNITVIAAWPRGQEPEMKYGEEDIGDREGMLERYIGPKIPAAGYPVLSDKRVKYQGGDDSTYGVLYRNIEQSTPYLATAFDYYKFKILPVGALPESAILAFQNGRYTQVKKFAKRIAGDRTFVFNYGFHSFQDMELHFIVDTRIEALQHEILELLANEEDSFEYIFRAIGWSDGTLEIKKRSLIVSNGGFRSSDINPLPNDPKFYGFNRWINTSVSTQYGTLAMYVDHAGYNTLDDIYFDANADLTNRGYRSINVDPSNPNVTSEHYDVPDNNV